MEWWWDGSGVGGGVLEGRTSASTVKLSLFGKVLFRDSLICNSDKVIVSYQ